MEKLHIGEINTLYNCKVDFGFYLNGFDKGEILIPTKYTSEDWNINDDGEVFIQRF